MRLNAYLARAGVASRRKADELIKAGRVAVNGEPGQLNTFVERRDRVEVDGKPVTAQEVA
ncbi:MAG: rRNA pseudouridine synthase, partial [Actinobacteria bacterium]